MTHFLFTYLDDFDNESVGGFATLTEYQKDIFLAEIKKDFRRGGTIYLGSEEREYDDYHELMACIRIKEISKSEYDTLCKLFDGNSFGFLGPVDETDIPDDDDEYEEDEEDDEIDSQEEFKIHADKVIKMIKDEFHIEETAKNGNYSRFLWKPTPITELEISINSFSNNGDEEVEVTLKKNGRSIDCNFFDIYDYSHTELKDCVKQFLDKTRTF